MIPLPPSRGEPRVAAPVPSPSSSPAPDSHPGVPPRPRSADPAPTRSTPARRCTDDPPRFDRAAARRAGERAIESLLKARITWAHCVHDRRERSAGELLGFPNPAPRTHTMGASIVPFATQKLPMAHLQETLDHGGRIDIVQADAEFLQHHRARFGWKSLEPIAFKPNPTPKPFNFRRPAFLDARTESGERRLVVATVPGDDYFRHYASLVRIGVASLGHDPEQCVRTVSLGRLSASLIDLKQLDRRFVKPGDRVVIGHVREMAERLAQRLPLQCLAGFENDHYGSSRFRLPNGEVVNFLGAKDSYWGDMAGDLAGRILDLGASELAYVSKLGTLTDPGDIYTRVFSPTRFVRLDHTRLVHPPVVDVDNPIARRHPELDSGVHASIPTIPEEDFLQRERLDEFGARSIDNEISCIAQRVAEHQARTGRRVPFVPLHFATDYLRQRHEVDLETPHDLSNNRSAQARAAKHQALDRIADLLTEHLRHPVAEPPTPQVTAADLG